MVDWSRPRQHRGDNGSVRGAPVVPWVDVDGLECRFFVLYLSLDACWKRNTVQAVATLGFNTLLLVHVAQILAETKGNNLGMGVVGDSGDYGSLPIILTAVQVGCVGSARPPPTGTWR